MKSAMLGVALAILASPALAVEVWVDTGATAKYVANATDPGIGLDWTQAGFDDSGWNAGAYGLGYDTTGNAAGLLATTVPTGTWSVYTRVEFQVTDPAAVQNVFLGVDYDDGFAAWINGVEIVRSPSMPAGDPGWDAAPLEHESSNAPAPLYEVFDASSAIPALQPGTNVLAIGGWNVNDSSSDLVLTVRLTANETPALVRGPYLQLGTDDGVVVRWRTNVPTETRVWYGDQPGNLTLTADVAGTRTEHVVALSGLAAGTRYSYAVGFPGEMLAGDDADHHFETAPVTGALDPLRVWVLGDSGTGDANAIAVRDAFVSFHGSPTPDLLLMLGDNAYPDGTDAEYQEKLFDIYPETLRTTVLWPTLGNHDGHSADSATQTGPYYDIFTLPTQGEAGGWPSNTEAYYSFDHGNVHFVVLDSHESNRAPGSTQMVWLGQDLANTSADWVIAFWHHPPYSKGSHDSDAEIELIEMRENAVPLLDQYGVDLTLSGHSHSYERTYLIQGAYATPTPDFATLQAAGNIVDAGNGSTDGVYAKEVVGPDPYSGIVHTVCGSSGRLTPAALDHPAVSVAWELFGSVVLDIDGNRLDATFLDKDGTIRDSWSIVKGGCPNGPDADDDDVCDGDDNCPADANPLQEDGDGDGAGDACDPCPADPLDDADADGFCADVDNCPGIANPSQTDPDADGLGSACDNCPDAWNPLQDDADLDGVGDVCDVCPADPQNDADGDGVCGDVDNCPAVDNPSQKDDDGDGAGNPCDPCPLDPLDDADRDGLCADVDNCPTVANALQSDGDFDGIGDACDACPQDPLNDPDGDGVCENLDNCPGVPNATQQDTDGDGLGDACDTCTDSDGDGFGNPGIPASQCPDDNCPYAFNPGQVDQDGDGDGDVCDICPADPQNDIDGDFVCADVDNCPAVPNPGQADSDGDLAGDACDPCPLDPQNDRDADGWCAPEDNCPEIANPGQSDFDGDGLGDVCDADDDNDSALDVADCAPFAPGISELPGPIGNTLVFEGRDDLRWKRAVQGATTNVFRRAVWADGSGGAPPSCAISETAPTAWSDPSLPPPGGMYLYVVAGRNACGDGPAGADSNGMTRGVPAVCPPQGDDTDGDLVLDLVDNCSLAADPTLADADFDFVGDVCDNCPGDFNPGQQDTDADGIGNPCDNCTDVFNPDQTDSDGDGEGDACDPSP